MKNGLEFRDIVKVFPGVRALDGVSFLARPGEVVAMLGENGAGKSTLLKILNGDYIADGGKYLLDEEECRFKSPIEAIHAGISVIYQERQIVPYLTVAENIFMEEIPIGKSRLINFSILNQKAKEIIEKFGLNISPNEQVRNLSVAHQQMVEIMKAYRRKPKVIAFDEPTASLSDTEIDILFDIINQLKSQGIIILYVSHRMKEIFQISDEVVVIKDGRFVKQMPTRETTEAELIKLMVGRDLGDVFQELDRNTEKGEVILKVEGLSNPWVHNVSFELRKGEILGFAGLVGAGRTETMRAIFGADERTEGIVTLEGRQVHFKSPKQAIENGIALVTEDRKDQGIFSIRSIQDNISVACMKSISRGQWINRKAEKDLAVRSIKELGIRTPNEEKHIGELSGGNQQKVILARWIAVNPKVLILDEPTKGIDVGAKAEIYQMICSLVKKGIGVIVVSSELPEILGISDRIIIMHDGRITGEVVPALSSEEEILSYAMKEVKEGDK